MSDSQEQRGFFESVSQSFKKDHLTSETLQSQIPGFLPENQKNYLQRLITKSAEDERSLKAVQYIIDTIKCVEFCCNDKGQEVLKGAHIVIQGDEDVYRKMMEETSVRNRISSHYRGQKEEEKGINLKNYADFLVGLTKHEGGQKKVFMQMEGHKVDFSQGIIRGAILLVLHMLDFLKYRWTGKNIGPCGKSEHTENNAPIVLPTLNPELLETIETPGNVSPAQKILEEKDVQTSKAHQVKNRTSLQSSMQGF